MGHVLRQVPAVMVVHDDAQVAGCAEHFLCIEGKSVGKAGIRSATDLPHLNPRSELQVAAWRTVQSSAHLIKHSITDLLNAHADTSTRAHLQLHDVGVLPALALREELRHDCRSRQLLVQLQELYSHLLPGVLVQRQLHEADVAPAL
jgi:hypothetical protein